MCHVKAPWTVALVFGIVGLAAPMASAHPGHGEVGASHFVTAPEHMGVVLVASAGGILAAWLASRLMRREAKA